MWKLRTMKLVTKFCYCKFYEVCSTVLASHVYLQSTGGLEAVSARPTEGCHIRQLPSGWQINEALVVTIIKESRDWASYCGWPSKRWDLASCPTVKSIISWCDYEQNVAYQLFSIVVVLITKLQTVHKSFLTHVVMNVSVHKVHITW